MNESSPPQPSVRIGIVEDDRLTRMLLVEMISRQDGLALAGHWGSAEEFWEQGLAVPLDMLLVDLDLPQEDGTRLISRVTQKLPDVACVVLTSSREPQDVFDALRSGASGYLVKDSSPRELLDGIRAVAQEGMSLSPRIARFLVDEFRNVSASSQSKPSLAVLTSRELEILRMMAGGMSPKDVATALSLSYETVRAHLKKTYQKLHVRTRDEAVARFALSENAAG